MNPKRMTGKQQKLIKEIPNLWRPEFIPFYPEKKAEYKFNDKETIVYGFVRHFLRNCAGKFFFTNEQLRYVLVGVKRDGTISEIVKSLVSKCPDIKTRTEIKKNGGTVRIIEWVGNQADLRKSVSPTYGKPQAIENKVNSINDTTIAPSGAGLITKDVPELIDGFRTVDPNWRRLFGRRNQRQAIERMLAEHGRPALEKIIAFLPRNNADPFAPKVTTPIQLEEKLGLMRAHWEQKKNTKSRTASTVFMQ